MAESFSREQQNNSRLDELAGKVSALRSVTVNIYDNARNQEVIDSSGQALILSQSEAFSSMSQSLRGSAVRLGRMAQQGNKVAILKLAGIIVGIVVAIWLIWGLFV